MLAENTCQSATRAKGYKIEALRLITVSFHFNFSQYNFKSSFSTRLAKESRNQNRSKSRIPQLPG
jgi:hypothetical protein